MQKLRWVGAVALAIVLLLPGCASKKPVRIPAVTVQEPLTAPAKGAQEAVEAAPKESSRAAVEEDETTESQVEAKVPREPLWNLRPELRFLKQRLALYQEKLASWESLDQRFYDLGIEGQRPSGWFACLLDLEETLDAYQQLSESYSALLQGASLKEAVAPGKPYQLDIRFLEGRCAEVFRVAESAAQTWVGGFRETAADQMAEAIRHLAGQGDDTAVVQRYGDLVASYPDYHPDPEIVRMVAAALTRLGRQDEAITLLESEAEKRRGETAEVLDRYAADLLFATGAWQEATAAYERLAGVLERPRQTYQWVTAQLALLRAAGEGRDGARDLFSQVVRQFLFFDGRAMPKDLVLVVSELERRFPDSPLTRRARELKEQVEQRVAERVGSTLVHVDELVAAKEFEMALEVLNGLLAQELPDRVREVVQATLDNTLVAQREEMEARALERRQAEQVRWDEANRLLGLRRYDEAIALFTTLLDGEFAEKAARNIEEAKLAAATEMRRQAATLFVKARKSNDPAQRLELMQESRRLLQEILDRYPDVAIAPKVEENLRALEEQLGVISPSSQQESASETEDY